MELKFLFQPGHKYLGFALVRFFIRSYDNSVTYATNCKFHSKITLFKTNWTIGNQNIIISMRIDSKFLKSIENMRNFWKFGVSFSIICAFDTKLRFFLLGSSLKTLHQEHEVLLAHKFDAWCRYGTVSTTQSGTDFSVDDSDTITMFKTRNLKAKRTLSKFTISLLKTFRSPAPLSVQQSIERKQSL
jgi:hypothetical protein